MRRVDHLTNIFALVATEGGISHIPKVAFNVDTFDKALAGADKEVTNIFNEYQHKVKQKVATMMNYDKESLVMWVLRLKYELGEEIL